MTRWGGGFTRACEADRLRRHESGGGPMATVCDHLSVEELEERYVACSDATASRHFQVIWLLARGHTVSQVSATTAFGERWIEQLLARYHAEGPDALGVLRRRKMAGCGRAARSRTVWLENSAWPRLR